MAGPVMVSIPDFSHLSSSEGQLSVQWAFMKLIDGWIFIAQQ